MNWKFVEYGAPGIKKMEVEAGESFARFMFNGFKPEKQGHYIELLNPDGVSVASSRERAG